MGKFILETLANGFLVNIEKLFMVLTVIRGPNFYHEKVMICY